MQPALFITAHSMNLLSSGSFFTSAIFIVIGLYEILTFLLKRFKSSLSSGSPASPNLDKTSRYSSSISLEIHNCIFSSFHRFIIFLGLPFLLKKDDINILVSITTFIFSRSWFPLFFYQYLPV